MFSDSKAEQNVPNAMKLSCSSPRPIPHDLEAEDVTTLEIHPAARSSESHHPTLKMASPTSVTMETTQPDMATTLEGSQKTEPVMMTSPKSDLAGLPQGVVSPASSTCSPRGAALHSSPESTSSISSVRGPRIKHVCRKAAVALGTRATFPGPKNELRLSALPVQEKRKILEKEDRPGMDECQCMRWGDASGIQEKSGKFKKKCHIQG